MTINCPICGKENNADNQYCAYCDATIQVAKTYDPNALPVENKTEVGFDVEVVADLEIDTTLKFDDIKVDEAFTNTFADGYVENETDDNMTSNAYETIQNDSGTDQDHVNNIEVPQTLNEEVHEETYKEVKREKPPRQRREIQNNGGDKSYKLDNSDEKSDSSFIKMNHLICPFCGNLNKQNQFFCQTCGCDLKQVKTVKVPAGQVDEYQAKYQNRNYKMLFTSEGMNEPEILYKKFQAFASDKRIETGAWKQAKEMTLETGKGKVTKSTIMFFWFGYFILKTVLRNVDMAFPFILVMAAYGIYKKFISGNDGDEVVLASEGVEVWDTTGKNNEKLREIKWSDINQLTLVKKGSNIKIKLHSEDSSKSCLLPVFSDKKRAMMLNVFGIIANRNKYNINLELNQSEESAK